MAGILYQEVLRLLWLLLGHSKFQEMSTKSQAVDETIYLLAIYLFIYYKLEAKNTQ